METPRPPPASTGSPDPDDVLALPAQIREDTDAGWGEPAAPDDDECLRRDRPPALGIDLAVTRGLWRRRP
jgi:hypothetical protein